MDISPVPYYKNLNIPLLVIKGAMDDRSSAEATKMRISEDLPAGADATFIIFPRAGHGIVKRPLGDKIPIATFPDGFPADMVNWILEENPPT